MGRRILALFLFSILVKFSLCDVVQLSDQKALNKFLRTHTNVLIFYQETSESGKDWLILLREAAFSIDGRGSIVNIDCSAAKKVCKRMKAKPAPVLLKHYKDGKFYKDYDRLKTAKSIYRFLEDPTSDMPWDEDTTATSVTHLNTEKELIRLVKKEPKPILLMFYAPWCRYCKLLKPEFAIAAQELKEEAVLAGMDVDKTELHEVRIQFNITGFPTLYYIHKGKVLYKYEGKNEKDSIVSWMRDPQPPKPPEEEKKWSDEDNAVDIRFATAETFDALLKENPSVLVMFYAPWCGHCKAMKPDYADAATKLRKDGIPGILAAVDATTETSIAQRYQVSGFPTIKYFKDGELAFDVNERTTDKIVEFMKDPKEPPPPPPPEAPWSEQPSEVHHLNSENYHSFLRKKKHVLVMLYAPWCGHCKKAKPEFMEAAETMKDNRKISFAALDCTENSDLCTSEGVTGFPTFLYYSFGKKDPKGYTMGREAEDFVAFMTNPSDPKSPGQIKHWKAVDGHKNLEFLDSTNFDTALQSVDALFVKFYAPWCGHCKAMKPAFAELAGLVKQTMPQIKVGTCDATEDVALAKRFEVSGYPSLLYITRDGSHEKYRGARTAEDMLAYIKEKQAKQQPTVKDETATSDSSKEPEMPADTGGKDRKVAEQPDEISEKSKKAPKRREDIPDQSREPEKKKKSKESVKPPKGKSPQEHERSKGKSNQVPSKTEGTTEKPKKSPEKSAKVSVTKEDEIIGEKEKKGKIPRDSKTHSSKKTKEEL